MRTRKAIYNNLAAALLQITIFIFGLIVPRLMIDTYGSQLNGLLSSTRQMVSYLHYLELGITSVLVYTLYEPLANKNYDEISPLVTRSKKEYDKISLGYFIGAFLLSLIYPLMLREDLGFSFVALMVFLIGVYGALDFRTLSKYKVILQADQRYYVVNLVTTLTTILQNITTMILLVSHQPIHLVVFIPTFFLPIKSLIVKLYIKNKYKKIDYKTKPSDIKLKSRKDAFITGLSDALNLSLPIVIVSLMVSLEIASVYSVYSMVFMGLITIIGVFTVGLQAAFGNMFAKGEKKSIIRSNNDFEFLLYVLLGILYSSALALIIPFVNIYIKGVADINYIYPMFGLLLTVWSVLHNSRLPNHAIINASGNWKITTKTNISQIIILTLGTVILGYFLGINGILLGMIIATFYKSTSIIYLSNKKILNISSKTSILRLIRIFFIIFLNNLPIILNLVNIDVDNFLEWTEVAIIFVIWATVITLLINYIFDSKTVKELYNKYKKLRFKNLKKYSKSNIYKEKLDEKN